MRSGWIATLGSRSRLTPPAPDQPRDAPVPQGAGAFAVRHTARDAPTIRADGQPATLASAPAGLMPAGAVLLGHGPGTRPPPRRAGWWCLPRPVRSRCPAGIGSMSRSTRSRPRSSPTRPMDRSTTPASPSPSSLAPPTWPPSRGGQQIGARITERSDDFSQHRGHLRARRLLPAELRLQRVVRPGRSRRRRHPRPAHRPEPGRLPDLGLRHAERAGQQRPRGAAGGYTPDLQGSEMSGIGPARRRHRCCGAEPPDPFDFFAYVSADRPGRLRQPQPRRSTCDDARPPTCHPRLGGRPGLGQARHALDAPRPAGAAGAHRRPLPRRGHASASRRRPPRGWASTRASTTG